MTALITNTVILLTGSFKRFLWSPAILGQAVADDRMFSSLTLHGAATDEYAHRQQLASSVWWFFSSSPTHQQYSFRWLFPSPTTRQQFLMIVFITNNSRNSHWWLFPPPTTRQQFPMIVAITSNWCQKQGNVHLWRNSLDSGSIFLGPVASVNETNWTRSVK